MLFLFSFSILLRRQEIIPSQKEYDLPLFLVLMAVYAALSVELPSIT